MLKENMGIAAEQEPMKFDLQLFAEDGEVVDDNIEDTSNEAIENDSEVENDVEETEEEITNKKIEYTPEELEKELQRRADKIVTKALKTQREKIYKDFQKKQEEEKLKAEKKYKELYERQQAEIEQERRELALERKENEAQKILTSKGLDPELVKFLDIKEDTDIYEVVDDFAKSVEGLVNNKVEQLTKKSQQSIGKSVTKKNETKNEDEKLIEDVKKMTSSRYQQPKNPYFKN